MSETTPLPVFGTPPPASTPVFDCVGIVGLGFVGTSVAMAIRQRWPSVLIVGIDHTEVLEAAMARQIVHVGGRDLDLLSGAHLVILAAPVGINETVLVELSGVLAPECLVTDVGAVKRHIVAVAAGQAPGLAFVGGHPLAGGPVRGGDSARPDLFVGRPWVLTPDRMANNELERVVSFITALGARPVLMTAHAHDELVAVQNQMPQLLVDVLMQVLGERLGDEGLALSGRLLAETTRLAAAPPGDWAAVVAANHDLLGPTLDTVIARLTEVRGHLTSAPFVDALFESASEWRTRLPHTGRTGAP